MLIQKTYVVTHRRGRGWRGGFFGSAVETYLYGFNPQGPSIKFIFKLLTPQYLSVNWSSKNSSSFLSTLNFNLGLWVRIGQGYGYSNFLVPLLFGRKVASVTSGISCPIRLLSGWQECFSQANNLLFQSCSS